MNGYSTDINGINPNIYKEIKIMSSTFNDLMSFQKSQIASKIVTKVMYGKSFTWSVTGDTSEQSATVSLDEQSDIPVTLPSEVKSAVNNALTTFNRAPDGYELLDFLPYEKELAA